MQKQECRTDAPGFSVNRKDFFGESVEPPTENDFKCWLDYNLDPSLAAEALVEHTNQDHLSDFISALLDGDKYKINEAIEAVRKKADSYLRGIFEDQYYENQ